MTAPPLIRTLACLAACASAIALSALAWAAPPATAQCGAESRRELHVTAYRSGWPTFAFVREIREVDLPAGSVSLSLSDVPDTVQRETVGMKVLEGAPLDVLEQTFGYDLLGPRALMRAAQGESIVLDHANAHSGELQPVPARVTATNDQGTVLQTQEGYTFDLGAERTRFARLPAQLSARPTLRWLANSPSAGKRRIELTYLMRGMGWSADYVATISRDASKLDLASWITFNNGTSVRLDHTHLALVAGQVNRVHEGNIRDEAQTIVLRHATLGAAERAPSRESLGELHLYKVPTPTDLEAHSVKNIQLFSLASVPIRRRWSAQLWVHPERTHATQTESPTLEFEFANDRKSNAGTPLPAGTVRVMAPDQKGTAHLVATTSIKDTPEGEKVALQAGRVADVRFVLKQTNYESAWFGAKKATFSLEMRNRSRQGGTARVDLHAGGDVQLEVTGAQVTRPSAATWRIEVPLATGETKKVPVIARREPRRP
ncbi:MAG: hypothetical protein HY898_33165 [Deltaproteobacteria bacterium]|nr:hypothetical protein [Deltaproteobacteria bacterium]